MSGEPRHEAFVWVGCTNDTQKGPHFPCTLCQWKSNLTVENAPLTVADGTQGMRRGVSTSKRKR